jgi:hypothetical protein
MATREKAMAVTGISNRGLATIAVLVSILWGCIFAERAIVRRAYEETQEVLHSRPEIPVRAHPPRQNPQPVVPVPFA